ncbi:molybdopterin molybdotransferase MoeA [Cryobacterium sp. TMT1-21]|uniref:Molybdopterin molybdenumtransferase n=2 Tax=Microbacteriaceae TaxID=85023 RepID=A0AAQ2C904_9MICO|nr:molybdopterin molybdotransferase MoeA [Cryobacterium shii]TFC84777.1 molybdopterin molybdotransferase MoeA [Cryobacterium sp. TmT2-59]TFD15755.1 molybdopterin molybdotransferase MoeA [Cryobacterium sp. TMT1-21]TFD19441.1 molybdopterin molybdotransferase MoeA [Cryobacterium sp. TMT4-10]TFD26752.1 molybdopterin molybdotransferase MoeA [Cryobacterium sp. TMT2-23]TFD37385.1 molybdopterin molybdotransferase MoeA [Cryobacterium sp. TMT2-10]
MVHRGQELTVAEGTHRHDHGGRHTHEHVADGCSVPASARTVAEQLAAVLAAVAPLPPALVSLDEALGLVLAEDIRSATDTPPFDNSAMDGYAVRRADLLGATEQTPVSLPVVADLAAGTAQNPRLETGQVARIMTGAPIPDGADAVVPIEDTDQGTQTVQVMRPPGPAAHIRRAGEDAHAGDTVLTRGSELWPTRIAAAASAGTSGLRAHPAPRVAVISTGSELVTPGEPTRRGQIPDSNSYLLAAAVAEAGGVPIRLGAVPDDENTLRSLLTSLAGTVDAIVLSGGVSVGAYDVVKAVLAPLGTVRFGPVKMQPGKPQGFGRWPADADGTDGPVIFALPGNPVSAFVSFEAFVRPALRRMGGHSELFRPTVDAVAAESWASPAGRAQYMPVMLRRDGTRTLARRAAAGGSGSHLVAGLGQAQGLAIVPEDVTRIDEGGPVTVMLVT